MVFLIKYIYLLFVCQVYSWAFIQEKFLKICSQKTCAIFLAALFIKSKTVETTQRGRLCLARPLITCLLSCHLTWITLPLPPFHLYSQNTPVSVMFMPLNSAIPSAQNFPSLYSCSPRPSPQNQLEFSELFSLLPLCSLKHAFP